MLAELQYLLQMQGRQTGRYNVGNFRFHFTILPDAKTVDRQVSGVELQKPSVGTDLRLQTTTISLFGTEIRVSSSVRTGAREFCGKSVVRGFIVGGVLFRFAPNGVVLQLGRPFF